MQRKLIFGYSKEGKMGTTLPKCDVPQKTITDLIPQNLLREIPNNLPR